MSILFSHISIYLRLRTNNKMFQCIISFAFHCLLNERAPVKDDYFFSFQWTYIFTTQNNQIQTQARNWKRSNFVCLFWFVFLVSFFSQNEMAEHWRIARLQNWKMRFDKLAKFGPIRLQGIFYSFLITFHIRLKHYYYV